MALVHRPLVVRVLAYAGTGILILLLGLVVLGSLAFLFWGLTAGPLWLRWSIGGQILLIALTFMGRSFHRKEF